MGVHGMVVFGGKRVFLSHIPMFRSPHDVQLVIEAAIPGDHPSFAEGLFTFEPEKFDLDALVAGKKTEMVGTLYKGSFEDGGQPIEKDVHVRVVKIVASRVPIGTEPPPATPTYWAVGDKDDLYLVHQIGRAPGFDHVVRAKVIAGSPVEGETVAIDGRADEPSGRATPGITLRGGKTPFEVRPVAESSCLLGPDFDRPCR